MPEGPPCATSWSIFPQRSLLSWLLSISSACSQASYNWSHVASYLILAQYNVFWNPHMLPHVWVICSFLIVFSTPLFEYTTISLSIFLLVELGLFLAFRNKDAENILVQVVLWTYTLIFLGYIPRSGIIRSKSRHIFNFTRNVEQISKVIVPFCSPTNKRIWVAVVWHPCEHWALLAFFMLAIVVEKHGQ